MAKERTAAVTATSRIAPCTCTHPYQDATYGKGNRVWNRTKQQKPEAERGWRCTVCGTKTT